MIRYVVCKDIWSFIVCGPHGVTLLSGRIFFSGLSYGNWNYVCCGGIRLYAHKYMDRPIPIQSLPKLRGPTWSLKVFGPYMVTFLNQTHVFEWDMTMLCYERTLKKMFCYNDIGLSTRNISSIPSSIVGPCCHLRHVGTYAITLLDWTHVLSGIWQGM